MKPLTITLLLDNYRSWFAPYAERLRKALERRGHLARLINVAGSIPHGDCVFFLSCEKLVSEPLRRRNAYNLVIHSSDLPRGRGWSPLSWEVLNEASEITTCLLEAVDQVDAGPVYLRNVFKLEGHELLPELHALQAHAIIDLVLQFVETWPPKPPVPQAGEPTAYPRRGPAASALDPDKPLGQQFDLLRICDNEAYPAYLDFLGHRYTIKIEKDAA